MNYEKRYKKSLERAKKLYKDAITLQLEQDIKDYEYIFPELAESEDEKIRKELLESFKYQQRESRTDKEWLNGIKLSEVVAWLEKQGEKKATDKIEPKFKVGDWVVTSYGKVNQVIAVDEDGDGFTLDDGTYFSGSWKDSYHLWTIEDAKDGDVLVDDLGNICIYKESSFSLNSMYYSYCYGNHKYFVDGGGSHVIVDTCPASKEQRNILFQKMKEEGYEWDTEKKELKKIDTLQPKFKVGDWVVNNNSGDIFQVTEIKDDEYCLWPLYCEICGYLRIIDVDTDYHLWTIQDAKDGDVLYSLDSKQPFIFKHRKPNEQAVVYCGINTYGKFFIWNTKDCVITTDKYIPATKEQRDTLFKAMAEAGYEWDFEKKELKLLITNGGDFESPTCWSKEDEDFYNDIIKYFSDLDYSLSNDEDDVINWLKSIKKRNK